MNQIFIEKQFQINSIADNDAPRIDKKVSRGLAPAWVGMGSKVTGQDHTDLRLSHAIGARGATHNRGLVVDSRRKAVVPCVGFSVGRLWFTL